MSYPSIPYPHKACSPRSRKNYMMLLHKITCFKLQVLIPCLSRGNINTFTFPLLSVLKNPRSATRHKGYNSLCFPALFSQAAPWPVFVVTGGSFAHATFIMSELRVGEFFTSLHLINSFKTAVSVFANSTVVLYNYQLFSTIARKYFYSPFQRYKTACFPRALSIHKTPYCFIGRRFVDSRKSSLIHAFAL